MKRWLLLLLVLPAAWRPVPLAAQARAADSLRALLRASPQPDTQRVRRLNRLASYEMDGNLPRADSLLRTSAALAQRLHYYRGELSALINLGTVARLQARYPQARAYTRRALALASHLHDNRRLAKVYLQLNLLEAVPGQNLAAALRAALRGLDYARRAGDSLTTVQLRYAVGNVYYLMGNYPEARLALGGTLAAAQALGDQYVQAATLSLLGSTEQQLGHWARALAYCRRSAGLNRQLGDLQSATADEVSLAGLLTQLGRYEAARQHAATARALARAHADAYNLPPAELALARAELALSRPDTALALARHAYALAQQARDHTLLAAASQLLAQAHAQRHEFAQAYRYQGRWVSYRDSLAGEATQRRISAVRYGYELEGKQAQIALLTQARLLQRQQLWGLLAGLLATALVAGLLLRLNYLRRRSNRELSSKNAHIARQRDDLDRALAELQATQQQLVQSEKMVALAALTAGVAHEIQNPLNFVNNFAEVSQELVAELQAEAARPTPDAATQASLLAELTQSLRLIGQHGQRAGGIVRGMLEHARADKGQRQPLDLNKAAEEYLRLALHNQQLRDPAFELRRTFALDPQLPPLPLVPQEVGRVLLNLFANAVYAVREKARRLGPQAGYVPTVHVSSAREAGRVLLRIRDNGPGIAAGVVDKIFEPFFTTKPTGEGTGLGLWFSYDIITKGYGGTLTVRTQEGEYTEFTIGLPLGKQPPAPLRAATKAAPPVAWAD